MNNVVFLLGALLSMVAAASLVGLFCRRWYDPIFRALTIYFGGAVVVNTLVLLRAVNLAEEWLFPWFRIAHATVLWYLMITLMLVRKRGDNRDFDGTREIGKA